jgi:hypothetical protein
MPELGMDVTAVLAVMGAVSGLAGTGLSSLTYRRNRPIVVVHSRTVSDVREQSFVQVDVRNEGQQGVTLTDVGLAICPVRTGRLHRLLGRIPAAARRDRLHRIYRRGVRYSDFAVLLDDDDAETDEQVFLEPGRHMTRRVAMVTANSRQHDGFETWPYAEDFAGRTFLADRTAHVHRTS